MKKQRQENMRFTKTFNGKANDTIHGRVDKQAQNCRVGPDLPSIASERVAPQCQVRTWPTPVIPAHAGIQRQPAALRHSRARGNPAHLAAAGNRFSPLSIINYPLSIRPAFTLVELLVVIVIIGVIAAIAIPSISGMQKAMAKSEAVNAVSSAISAARGWTNKRVKDFTVVNGQYSGCAALFTPAGTIRFLENDETARRSSDGHYLESLHALTPPPPSPFSADQINGYTDIPTVSSVKLPNSIGVVGIYRTNSGTEYLSPPFAVHFAANGQLQTSQVISPPIPGQYPDWGFVYYDSRGNTYGATRVYDLNSDRSDFTDYNYTYWSSANNILNDVGISSPLRQDTNQLKLPFDRIEAVIGVIVYNKQDFKNAGFGPTSLNGNSNNTIANPTDPDANTAAKWLVKYGSPVYVSRATGTVVRGVVTEGH